MPTPDELADSRDAPRSGTRRVAAINGERRPAERWFPWLLTLAYAITLGIGLWHHEIWRDEAQAWLLARFADSPAEVLRRIAAEGHPGLWHLLLWGVSRLVAAWWVMQLLHGVIATAGAALIAFASPFTKLQRVLLCFGYYSLFEYGMISRGYSLGIVLILAAVALSCTPRRRLWLIGGLLALAANTSMYGTMIAGAVALGLCLDTGLRWVASRPDRRSLIDAAVGFTLWTLGAAVCVWQVGRYTRGESTGSAFTPEINPYAADDLIANFAEAMLPLLNFWDAEFWGRNMLRLPGGGPGWLLTVIAMIWLFVLTVAFSRRGAAAGMFVSGVAVMFLFGFAVYRGWFTRHLGHYFILLLATLWFYRGCRPIAVPVLSRLAPRPEDAGFRRRASALWTGLLALHVAIGLAAWGIDLARPFSGAPSAAAAIRDTLRLHPDTALLTSLKSPTSPVAALIDRPLWSLHTRRPMAAMDWTLDYDTPPADTVATLILDADRHGPNGGVVLLNTGLPPRVPRHHWVLLNPHRPLPVQAEQEDYNVWRLQPDADGGGERE